MASEWHVHRGCLALLREMAAANPADDESEIVHEEGQRFAWYRDRQITQGTLRTLLNFLAVSDQSLNSERMRRFRLNDTGRAIARRPALAMDIYRHVHTGRGAFTITNNFLVPLKDSPNA